MDANKATNGEREPGTYRVSEVFYSLQGEGRLAGVPMVFVRLSWCNLRCARNNAAGFDCDTDFARGERLTLDALLKVVKAHAPAGWVLLTGGEPALQVDAALVDALHGAGYRVGIETNGTVKLPEGIDHVTVSPKSAWHTLRQRTCHDLKIVRAPGMTLPEVVDGAVEGVQADAFIVSPAAAADGTIEDATLRWCIEAVKNNPEWQLSVQLHKLWRVR